LVATLLIRRPASIIAAPLALLAAEDEVWLWWNEASP
jgi:hypothetical protein